MKKKFFIVLAVLTCILGLAACGKKPEEPTEETHNYAVNPVQNKTDTTTEETGDIQTLTESDPWNRQESNDKASEVMTSDNVDYTYPNDRDDKFYVNGIPVAQIAPYCFTLNDVSVSINEAEELREASVTNHIYCEGYSMSLHLSDVAYDARYSDQSLAAFMPAVNSFRLGNKDIQSSELVRSTNDFEGLIKFLNTNFTSRQTGNTDDIFSLAVESRDNEIWGKTYVWKFSINESSSEYTADELSAINTKRTDDATYEETTEDGEVITVTNDINSDINSDIIVEGAYSADGQLSYYTVKMHKLAHFWTYEIMLDRTHEIHTGEYETVPFDADGNEIPVSELDQYDEDEIFYQEREVIEYETVKEPSGQFITQQNGYDFSYSYIKLNDGSYIGMDNFSFTVHNPDLNRSLTIDYKFE